MGCKQLDEAGMFSECLAHRHVKCRALSTSIDVVASDAVLERIKSREHRCKRWTTEGGCNIAALKDHAARGQLVQMRCVDIRMPHESVVGPGLVITDDDDDVGLSEYVAYCAQA